MVVSFTIYYVAEISYFVNKILPQISMLHTSPPVQQTVFFIKLLSLNIAVIVNTL